jgi:hypothetical protein
MRSTRAAAAVARLNERSPARQFRLVNLGTGLFALREQLADSELTLADGLSLDDFVLFVNALGPQTVPRITRNDVAFARQLIRKPKA